MGPSGGLSTSTSTTANSLATINGNAIPAPPFFSYQKTNKRHYRSQLRLWMKAVNKLASNDNNNAKSFRQIVGFHILSHCDQQSQEMLNAACNSKRIDLDSSSTESEFSSLIEGVIDTIAKDADHEVLENRVKLLNSIHSCVRDDNESPANFATRFNSRVSVYINAHKPLSEDEEETFALMLIANSNLKSTDLNSLNFHVSSTSKALPKRNDLFISQDNLKTIRTSLKSITDKFTGADDIVKKILPLLESANSTSSFIQYKLQDVVTHLSKIKLTSSLPKLNSFLGTRRSSDTLSPGSSSKPLKRSKIICFECGGFHSYRDNPHCLAKYLKRRRETPHLPPPFVPKNFADRFLHSPSQKSSPKPSSPGKQVSFDTKTFFQQ